MRTARHRLTCHCLTLAFPCRSEPLHHLPHRTCHEPHRRHRPDDCFPPCADARAKAPELVEAHGDFIEIHLDTALAVCEARDRKGLYAQARAGKIKQFTGISDPCEIP
jgi:hypothetical protein